MTKRPRPAPTDFWSAGALAARVSLHEESVRKLLRLGRVPAVKFGTKWMIPAAEADRFCDDIAAGRLAKAGPPPPRIHPRRTILRPIKVAGRR